MCVCFFSDSYVGGNSEGLIGVYTHCIWCSYI